MLKIQPFFNIDLKGEIAIITIAGLWDKQLALVYERAVDEYLATINIQRVFPISNLELWSIPDLEISTIVNQVNNRVQEKLDFEYNALITPKKHRRLFLDIIQQFNLEDTNIEAQAFDTFQEAVAWGKALGFNFDQVPLDYDQKLLLGYQ